MYTKLRYGITLTCALVLCIVFTQNVKATQSSARASLYLVIPEGSGIAATVKNIGNNQAATAADITWTNATAGEDWKIADQYIELTYNPSLPQFWGLQIYTDNKNQAIANPRYTGEGSPAGLLKVGDPKFVLPIAWVITDHILTPAEMDNPLKYKPVERIDRKGFTSYLWHYFKDKSSPDVLTTPFDESFRNAEDYVALWNQNGIAWGEGGRSGKPATAYVYLAANFIMANVNTNYSTNTLTIETYHGVSPFPLYIYKDAPLTRYPSEPGATLANHYAPGYMNYNSANPNIIFDDKYTTNPHIGRHCLKIGWNGRQGPGGNWTGAMWLEPEQEWTGGPSKGYDLRGVTHLSFWTRTDPQYANSQVSVYFGLGGDSCRRTPPYELWIPLTTDWQFWVLPVYPLSPTGNMSHVSGGFGIALAQEKSSTGGAYTVYLDDIRFLAPEPLLEDFTFTPGSQGWQFDNTQAASYGMNPAEGYPDPANSRLVIHGDNSYPQPKYGVWYYNHPGNNIKAEPNRLYKSTFRVGTDQANPSLVPMFRCILHSMYSSTPADPANDFIKGFQVGTTTTVTSTHTGSSSPSSNSDKNYEVYFSIPDGSLQNEMALSFDYVNTNTGFDPNSSTAAVYLKDVIVKEATNAMVAKELRRFTFDSSLEGWQFDNSEASGYGMNPARGFRNAAVGSLRIDGYNPVTGQPVLPQPKYGKWYYNILGSNIKIEPNRLYKATFTVGTDQQDSSQVPMFRCIAHSMYSSTPPNQTNDFAKGFQVGTTTTVSSMHTGSSSPSSGNDKIYEVYFMIPTGSLQNEMAFTFDYINTNSGFDPNSSTAAVDLKEVVIYEVYRDALQ